MTIREFTKTYGDRTVLQFPGMELDPGTIYAVIGPNGCGKSTLAKVLAGAEKPDGKERVLDLSSGDSLGYSPQKNYPFQLSVERNLLLATGDTPAARERADAYLDALGMTGLRGKKASRLSGGETAKLAMARVMMEDCALLILDEPTAAMDIQSTLAAEQLILDYRARTRAAVLLITHSLAQALRISDQTLFLAGGCLLESGPSEQVLRHPQHEQTKSFIEFYGL